MERRSCQRFVIPEATVDWTPEADARKGGSHCPLRDLSRGGARFVTEGPPRVGTALRLRIAVAGEAEALEVRGKVVWTAVSAGRAHHVAVEFAPYGAAPGANPPAVLERLTALEARFLRR